MLLLLLILISSNVVLNHALIAPSPSSYSSAAVAVRGRALITTLRFPLQGNYYKHPHQHLVNHNDRLSRRVLMVRGGGDSNIDDTTDNEDDYINTDSDDDDATEDGEEYTNNDTSDDEDESAITSDNNKIDEPQSQQQQDIEERRYQLSSQLSSQSRNFGIATALWGSLFFDSILNTAKRTLLFPITTTTTQSATATTAAVAALNAISSSSSLRATIIPTTLLASGFGLASIISFLLWRDLETRADMLSSDDGRSSSKGDDFLSLSTTTTTLSSAATTETDNNEADDVGLFASQTRTTLYTHLSIFGILSLASHTGYYFSKQAPFLGMSAAIINIHNTLAYVSALLKEKNVEEGGLGLVGGLLKLLVMWPIKLFQSMKQNVVNEDEDGSGNKNKKLELSSFIYRLGTIVAYMQCIPICKYLYTTIRLLLMPSSSTGGVVVQQELLLLPNVARAICLKIASVARLSLVAGALHSLYTANKSKVYRHHPFFTVLGGMFGVGCLSVTGAILFDTLTGSTSSLTALSSVAVRNGLTVMLFGLFAIYNSVKGIIASLPQSTAGVET